MAKQKSKNNTRPKYLTPTQSEKHNVSYVMVGSVEYYDRNCHKTMTHDAHSWKTYYYGTVNAVDPENAYCNGTGTPPVYTWTSTYKKDPVKDYSLDQENFPHSDPITVTQAKKIAYDMHKNQVDKAGEPYRLHLSAVQKGVQVFGGSKDEEIAALFHDAVEDDHTTYALLKKINVSDMALVMIEAVSKRSSEEQNKYLARIIGAGKEIPTALKNIIDPTTDLSEAAHGACRVKLADLTHNTRHDRLKALLTTPHKGQATVDRLLKKYRPAMAALMLELGMIVDEGTQKKLATKPQGTSGGWTGTSYSTATKGSTWEVDSLFRGDWVSFWDAPIMERTVSPEGDTHVRFILANGEVRDEPKKAGASPRKLYVFTQSQWAEDASITFAGVTTAQIMEYSRILTALKPETKFDSNGDQIDYGFKQDEDGYWWDTGLH